MKSLLLLCSCLFFLSSFAQVSASITDDWGNEENVVQYTLEGDFAELTTSISHGAGVAAQLSDGREYKSWSWKDIKIERLTAPRIDLVLYVKPEVESESNRELYFAIFHHETGENLTGHLLDETYPFVQTWLEETLEFYCGSPEGTAD